MGMIIARMIPKTARGTPKSENVPKRDSTGTGEAATTRVLAAPPFGTTAPDVEADELARRAAIGAIWEGAAIAGGKTSI